MQSAVGNFATELKFELDTDMAASVRDWVRTELVPDPHAADAEGDGYRTTSLYFDTEDLDVFFRRNSNGRAKFRIRRYNNGPVLFVERKLKRGGLVTKRRTEIFVDEVPRVLDADGDWPGRWFARRLSHRQLRPVCQIEYRRTARLGMSSTGPLRLTIDRQIVATPINSVAFASDPGIEVLPGREVLELKYRVHVPPLFKRLIEKFNLEPRAISKYRMSVAALGLVGDSDEEIVVNA
ncbi:MAG TPA: polyphosphate polymerase domain-containing protein [Terriglobia bacterium]|nr:polyphosphate polymerase domain-containing protein [Terriglobia bacterium]